MGKLIITDFPFPPVGHRHYLPVTGQQRSRNGENRRRGITEGGK